MRNNWTIFTTAFSFGDHARRSLSDIAQAYMIMSKLFRLG